MRINGESGFHRLISVEEGELLLIKAGSNNKIEYNFTK